MKPRVGIFQADWPVQSQTYNCVFVLAEAGYLVDLFLYESPVYYELDELRTDPNVRLHNFSWSDRQLSGPRHALRELKQRIASWPVLGSLSTCLDSVLHQVLLSTYDLYAFLQGRGHGLLPDWLLQKTHAVMEDKKYKCLIGIEKKGLIWAGQVAERLKVPYMYHSLELYTWDHPAARNSFHNRRAKLAEEDYHRRSYATIVQDPERAEVLLKDNGVDSCDLFYVPISLLGEPYRGRSSFFQDRFQLRCDQPVILQFGLICKERFSIELARVAQTLPAGCALALHGFGPGPIIRTIKRLDIRRRVLVSLEMVPADRIVELVSSAHIGLALYASSPANDQLTSFSSEKVALYLQCGLPLIAFDYPGYRRLMDRYQCGVTIRGLDELPRAVERILSSYDEYRDHAYECFTDSYQFPKHYQKVVQRISEL